MIPIGVVQSSRKIDIPVNVNQFNLDLRDLYDSLYPGIDPQVGDDITFTIDASVFVGSPFNNQTSLEVGDWPVGVIPTLINQSMDVIGKGGQGSTAKSDGMSAFRTTVPIRVDNSAGRFAGGGGGGRSSLSLPSGVTGLNYQKGGGGGAGIQPGGGGTGTQNGVTNSGSSQGEPGTQELGGDPGTFFSDPNQPSVGVAGQGGDLGQAGGASSRGPGGDPGYSVIGYSLVIWIDEGILTGPTTG